MTDAQNDLQSAIEAIQSGNREAGKRLLAQILHAAPQDVQAWLWMSEVVETDQQRRECLRRVLALDPQNQAARAALAKSPPTAPNGCSHDIEPLPVPAAEDLQRTTAREPDLGWPDQGRQGPATTVTTIRSSVDSTQAPPHDPIERWSTYRRIMLAGAMTVTLFCGLLLLLLTLTQLIPQARERIELASEPPSPTATLWCPECERAGRPVILQARIGRGFLGGGKAGELPHGTPVSVLDYKRAVLERRYYAEVTAEGQRGWVPESQLRR